MLELLSVLFAWAKENPVGQAIINVLQPVYDWFDGIWLKTNITFLTSDVAFFIIFY